MKIILLSIGTRGDMEPFLAIGELLKEKGHQVICAFPEQFKNLAEDSNLEFASLGKKFIEMLDSNDGKIAMGGSGSGLKKFLAYAKLAKNQTEANKEMIYKQYEIVQRVKPDRILYNLKAVYPLIWGINKRDKIILVSPVPYLHYVKGHSHIVFNSNFGSFFNKLTYSLANFGLAITVMISKKWLNITEKISRKQIKTAMLSNKSIYTISPSLFPRPDYWNENLDVLGYHEKNKTINWQPDKELGDFLTKHDRILFITFGSMLNPEPVEKTKIILEILERNKIPAIINTAFGGLIELKNYDTELIHFVSQIPYDWVFPKMYAVIHHGGSGTTHLALKYGCASMIIPHVVDQFVWDKIIYDLGVGPRAIKIGKITMKNLDPKILELVNNSSFKSKAEQVANQMEKEDYKEEIYKSIIEK